MTNRIICALLVSVMLTSLFACGGENKSTFTADTSGSSDTSADTEAAETDTLAARALVSDGVGEYDFDGEEIVFYTQPNLDVTDVYTGEQSGDVVEDALYQRNSVVSERFDIKMSAVTDDYVTMATNYTKNIKAGDDYYDIVLGHAVYSSGSVLSGCFYDLYTVPNLNFDQPWYPQYSIANLTVNGKMYITVGDLLLSTVQKTYCMYFNKKLAEDYNITGIYDMVKSGSWTIDKLLELTSSSYTDLNGNNERDENDLYYFVSSMESFGNTYLWAFDQPIVSIDADGTVSLPINCEKTVSIFEKLSKLMNDSVGAYCDYKFNADVANTEVMFINGQAIFYNDQLGFATGALRKLDSDYGIIPYVKWDEAQKDYLTMADGSCSVLCIPVSVVPEHLEMLGAVIETLCAESWKTVLPAYYDVALKVKGTRDEESVAMIDTILNGRKIDFAYIYDYWMGYAFTVQDLLVYNKNKGNFSSYFASKQKSATKYYQKVANFFYGE